MVVSAKKIAVVASVLTVLTGGVGALWLRRAGDHRAGPADPGRDAVLPQPEGIPPGLGGGLAGAIDLVASGEGLSQWERATSSITLRATAEDLTSAVSRELALISGPSGPSDRDGPIDLGGLTGQREALFREHGARLLREGSFESAARQFVRLLAGDDLKQGLLDLKSLWKAIGGMHPHADTEVRLLTLRGYLQRPLRAEMRQLCDLFVAYAYLIENEWAKSLAELETIGPKITVPKLRDQVRLVRASNHIKLGEADKALVELRAVRDGGSDDEQRAKAAFLLGWLRLLDGEKELARECFEQTVKFWPDTPFGQRASALLAKMRR